MNDLKKILLQQRPATNFCHEMAPRHLLAIVLLLLLPTACSTVARTPDLTDIAPKTVESIQSMFAKTDGLYDGFWDITASGDEHQINNNGQTFDCPPLNQTYRVIVFENQIRNAITKDSNKVMVSDTGEFSFDSDAVKLLDSFMQYELMGRFPDTSTDFNSTGSGTMKWRNSLHGTVGKGCNAQLSISKSKVKTHRVSGKNILFNKKAWAKVNNHHDKRLPGFVIAQEPKHGSISARMLKNGQIIYSPNKDYAGEDFLALRLWQSGEPFFIYRYYNLLIE